MKKVLLTLCAIIEFILITKAQVLNQLSIIPDNPTEMDTIYIISDFTYQGACNFGLVYYNSYIVDSTIFIFPLYCGYWDTSQCNSIDTFKVGPFSSGHYILNIEYHQGSVCPVSGFDAIIYYKDSSINVNTVSKVLYSLKDKDFQIKIYPNPSKDYIKIYIDFFKQNDDYQIRIINLLGQQVYLNTIN